VIGKIFSYDFPKIKNRHKISLRSFENVGPVTYFHYANSQTVVNYLTKKSTICDILQLEPMQLLKLQKV